MINPELLKSFVAAADCGSFSAAARKLDRKQSTISSNIAKLEDLLAVELFSRQGKYPQLSSAGHALYESAKQALESSERFTNKAQLLAEGEPANIRFGIDEDLPLEPFQELLQAVRRHHPQLELCLLRQAGTQLVQKFKHNDIDLVLTPTLESSSNFYEFQIIGKVELLLVCGEKHPFAGRSGISSDELMAHTQIVPLSGQDSLYKINYISPYRWSCQGYEAMVEMVRAGIGWAMLPQLPGTVLPSGLARFQPDFTQQQLATPYELLWPKNGSLSQVGALIRDWLMTSLNP